MTTTIQVRRGTVAQAMSVNEVLSHCVQYQAVGAAFYIETGCTDSTFSNCFSGPSGSYSFYAGGWNNMFVNCKGFWAGYNYLTNAWSAVNGWEVVGLYNVLSSCQSQQSGNNGFEITGDTNSLTACEADGNGAYSKAVSSCAGINLNGAGQCSVTGCVGGNRYEGAQLYGVQTVGNCGGTQISGNTVKGSTGYYNMTGTGYVLTGGYGPTSARPGGTPMAGCQWYDTTLNIPIWYSGSAWTNASGATV